MIKKETTCQHIPVTFIIDDPGEHMQRFWSAGQFYEHSMLDFIRQRWSNKDASLVFIDAGACLGNHTLYFSIIMQREVYSFEPHGKNFSILEQNLAANNAGCHAINKALGDRTGFKKLMHIHGGNSGMFRIDESGNETVEVTTIDKSIPKGKAVGLIKIDVEGYNLPVLRGAKRVIRRDHPEVYIECATNSDLAEADSYLKPLGYRRQAVFNRTPTYFYYYNL